jgi:biotin-dependent carboxylase-like uncharacterized protein
MSVEVIRPGLLTTLQDRGRFGCALLGVGRAGAMDDVSMRLANALVGNALDDAVIEITLTGPRLRFGSAATIALTGADWAADLDGKDMPAWRRIAVDAGAVLDVGAARRGTRAYLAIAGGFAAERMLGSASTDVNARLGGLAGRPLRENDRLEIANPASARGMATRTAHWSLDPRPWFDPDSKSPIRLVRGHHFDALDAASRAALFEGEFRIAPDSNRVGYRLDGPGLRLTAPLELVSEPLAAGTVQVPPGGQPIVLMVEHPTVGGYPRIGHVAAIDMPHLAQRRPGDRVRFAEISLDDAQKRYLERERELAELIRAIGERLEK